MNLLPSVWLSARVRVPLYNEMGIHTGSAALITCGFVADTRSLMVIPGCGCQGNFVMYLQPWPKHPSFLLVVASVACLEVENSLTQNLLAVISLIIAWNWGMLFTFCGLWSQLYCKLHPYTPFGTRGRTCLELWVLHNDNVLTHCMSKTVLFFVFCLNQHNFLTPYNLLVLPKMKFKFKGYIGGDQLWVSGIDCHTYKTAFPKTVPSKDKPLGLMCWCTTWL